MAILEAGRGEKVGGGGREEEERRECILLHRSYSGCLFFFYEVWTLLGGVSFTEVPL